MRERLRRIPRPLALLLPVVALFGVAWALIVPAWGNPDEDAHFAYSQTLVERGELPGSGENQVSTEQRLSMDFTNTDETVFFREAKPEWTPAVERSWERLESEAARADGGAPNATDEYPPAYYLYESVAYALTQSEGIFTRVYAMRLFSAVWLLVTTTAAWLLAGEIFRRHRPRQLVTAAAVGLWPMLTFISASLNPDAMVVALSALSTWLGVSLLRRPADPVRAGALCLCLGLALVTKASALALVPAVAFVLLVAAVRAARRITVRRLATGAVVLAFLALPLGAWAVIAADAGRPIYAQTALVSNATGSGESDGGTDVPSVRPASAREFASYLWQFYLFKLPFQHEIRFMFPVISDHPAYQIWLGGGWATFGWVNIWFPEWVYVIFLVVTLLAVAGAAVTGVRALGAGRRPPLALAAFLLLMPLALLAGLHWTDFHMYLRRDPPFLQGRYLLPLAPIFALVLAQATRVLPRRLQPLAQAGVLGGLVVLQLAALALVTDRFYG